MADLIVSINFEESRKKQNLLIEVFEGVIPHLKSKQFSGPLRNVNLMSISSVDNMSQEELEGVKEVFNGTGNLQLSKNQYLYSAQTIPFLRHLVGYGCLFYKDCKTPMYCVEELNINTGPWADSTSIGDIAFRFEKTKLYLDYEIQADRSLTREIIPLLYIDINMGEYPSELFFDYGMDVVPYSRSERLIQNSLYRNYGFEQKIIGVLKQSHWMFQEHTHFIYVGHDIISDLTALEDSGIRLFTKTNSPIYAGKIISTNIRYDIDWFTIDTKLQIAGECVEAATIPNFGRQRNNWIELNGRVLFIPDRIRKLERISKRDEGVFRASKKELLDVLDFAVASGVKQIANLDELVRYDQIQLNVPKPIFGVLRDYQIVGVQWLLSLNRNGFGGCLADDMGLGKTLQIIAYLSDNSQRAARILIIVPKTLLDNWKKEFLKFSPETKVYIYHGMSRNQSILSENRVVITTYGTLVNDIDVFSRCCFDQVIIDEAQYIKNARTKAYRAIRNLPAKTKLLLTGTPIENNIREFWDLMRIANPCSMSYSALSTGLEQEDVVAKVQVMTEPFLLRRCKADVLKDLPEKQEQTVYCTFDEAQRQLYRTTLNSIIFELNRKPDSHEIKSNSIVLNGLLYLQEICCHPRLLPKEYNTNSCYSSAKLDVLVSMIAELYSSGHKIVVFSRFTRMLEIIEKTLVRLHLNIFVLSGRTRNRQSIVDDFEESSDGVFLISLKAGGVGLNLASADTAIIYDPWWNPAVERQAQDRIYRIGQKNKVIIYRLIASDTIEEKIQILQRKKKDIFDRVVSNRDIPSSITIDDLRELISSH